MLGWWTCWGDEGKRDPGSSWDKTDTLIRAAGEIEYHWVGAAEGMDDNRIKAEVGMGDNMTKE